MRRRDFITLLGGAALASPPAARAQDKVRQVAVVMATYETDPDGRARLQAFLEAFEKFGWTDRRNVRIHIRWAEGSLARTQEIAAEFVALAPDVIVANSTTAIAAMKKATTTIPTVFVLVNEPVTQGFIASMARPGGNITGFTMVDFSVLGKSIEMLQAMAPALTHAGLMFNPETYPYYDTYLRAFQTERRLPLEVSRAAVQSPADIEAAIAAIAEQPGGGVVVPPDPFTVANRTVVHAALERYRLPHIITFRQFVREGALMSYGPDVVDILRRSADYVDRILKGANPGELPAQAPDKFELAINLKTAKAFGLAVPPTLIALADEVIE
jgi:putative ABC transport system substrate-binding protein